MRRLWIGLILFVLTFGVTVNAGDGVPDAYLSMEATSIEDGARDVPVDGEIAMKFSNNVVNMKVYDNNLTCFTLIDSQNNSIDIEVLMGDDQIDRTIKNDIVVRPVSSLKEGEQYRLIISENLMSKNGNNMMEDIEIGFETAGGESNTSMVFISGAGGVVLVAFLVWFLMSRRSNKAD